MYTSIQPEDVAGLGVYGLADTPELDVTAMQTKFDEYSWFLKNFINAHILELQANTAASNTGATIPSGLSGLAENENIQEILNVLASTRTDTDRLITLFQSITSVATTLDSSSDSLLPTTKAVVDRLEELGAGDMTKATYDQNKNGVVDDAEKLGGNFPAYYATKNQADMNSENIDIINRNLLAIINAVETLAQAPIDGMTDNYVIYKFDANTIIEMGELNDDSEPYYVEA